MDLTLVETAEESETPESQDPLALAEAALKRRVLALIEKVTFVVFSYVAQVHYYGGGYITTAGSFLPPFSFPLS
jgi:hypothetical protein